MKVTVDRGRCVAGGICAVLSPEVFDQDDDGIVILLNDAPEESLHESVREAAEACPAMVIRLEA